MKEHVWCVCTLTKVCKLPLNYIQWKFWYSLILSRLSIQGYVCDRAHLALSFSPNPWVLFPVTFTVVSPIWCYCYLCSAVLIVNITHQHDKDRTVQAICYYACFLAGPRPDQPLGKPGKCPGPRALGVSHLNIKKLLYCFFMFLGS